MSGNAQQSGQPQSGSARDFGSALWHDRFMAALAGASESDPRQLKAMLRIGLGVILVFEVATWSAVVRLEPALLYAERPFFIFDIALVGFGFCLTYCDWFRRNWRTVTMAFCLILIASRTLSSLAIHEDEPLVLALFALALGTAVLVPWSARWQGGLTLAGLIAFAIATADGVIEPIEINRWLVLAAVGAFTLSFSALKDHYRSQAILIDALLDKEKRLARSQAMLRTLFDAVPDIVTLTRFSDGKLIDMNEELLRLENLAHRVLALAGYTLSGLALHDLGPQTHLGRGQPVDLGAEPLLHFAQRAFVFLNAGGVTRDIEGVKLTVYLDQHRRHQIWGDHPAKAQFGLEIPDPALGLQLPKNLVALLRTHPGASLNHRSRQRLLAGKSIASSV